MPRLADIGEGIVATSLEEWRDFGFSGLSRNRKAPIMFKAKCAMEWTIVLGMLGGATSLPGQSVVEGWVERFDGIDDDYGEAITLDASGNVFVVGFTFEATSGSTMAPRYLTIKYSPTGERVWTRTYTTGTSYGSAYRLATDSTGAVIVGGIVQQSDWAIVKYGATGNQEWVRTRDASSTDYTGPADIKIGPDDAVIVGGYDIYATLTKYSSAGTLEWTRQHTPSDSRISALAVDAAGNIYAAGAVLAGALATECLLLKYTPAGVREWVKTFGTPGSNAIDIATGIEIDLDQNIVVIGGHGVNSPAGADILVRKYDPSGTLLWSQTLGLTPNRDDDASDVAIDGAGNIFVTGNTTLLNFTTDSLLAKYDSSGLLLWTQTFGGAESDWSKQLALDADGNCYTTGVFGIGSATYQYDTRRYSNDGALDWQRSYAGPAFTALSAGLAVGSEQQVYVTGWSWGGDDMDAATLQYLQIDAANFVRGDVNADGAFNIADPIGVLSYLFSAVSTTCLAAHDVNGDGAVDLGDAIFAIGILFGSGDAVPAPYPNCGVVVSADLLGCALFAACP